mmetsp:Transcript_10576/g.29357  ORF Transcript_10576/g.29357 Transcript_10576/m.29357 type:complete len:205 (-) Transcript_10576:141-755(-)
MVAGELGVADSEADHLITSSEDTIHRKELSGARGRHRCGTLWRMCAIAWAVLIAMLWLGATAAWHGSGPGPRTKTWSGRGDVLAASVSSETMFEALWAWMRGFMGTCLSAANCEGNANATTQACGTTGQCATLSKAYCCTNPEMEPTVSIKMSQVTCKCATTSRTLQKLKDMFTRFKDEVINVTGLCQFSHGGCSKGGTSQTFR